MRTLCKSDVVGWCCRGGIGSIPLGQVSAAAQRWQKGRPCAHRRAHVQRVRGRRSARTGYPRLPFPNTIRAIICLLRGLRRCRGLRGRGTTGPHRSICGLRGASSSGHGRGRLGKHRAAVGICRRDACGCAPLREAAAHGRCSPRPQRRRAGDGSAHGSRHLRPGAACTAS